MIMNYFTMPGMVERYTVSETAKIAGSQVVKDFRISEVVSFTCEFFDLEKDLLYSKSRLKPYVEARYIIMTLMVANGMTYFEAAGEFDRDHATINNAAKRIREFIETEAQFRINFKRFLRRYDLTSEYYEKFQFSHKFVEKYLR